MSDIKSKLILSSEQQAYYKLVDFMSLQRQHVAGPGVIEVDVKPRALHLLSSHENRAYRHSVSVTAPFSTNLVLLSFSSAASDANTHPSEAQ